MVSEGCETIERALHCSVACLLPPLTDDFDTKPMTNEIFKEFRSILVEKLYLLLDILYQNSNLLNDYANDLRMVQLQANLFLLTCEQCEPNPYFQTDQKILIDSLENLISDHLKNFDTKVIQKVIETYKKGLRQETWKRSLGLVHGFPKFCDLLFEHRHEIVDRDLMLFILSVGSNLASHYDTIYSTIGLKIYRKLLVNGNKEILKEINIIGVIFKETIAMTQKCSELEFNDHLFECLCLIVELGFPPMRFALWNQFDEVIGPLLTRFSLENEPTLTTMMVWKIVKLCGTSYMKIPEAETISNFSAEQIQGYLGRLKIAMKEQQNLHTMRWTKHLMEMMVRESTKMLSDSNTSFSIILGFHSIYIISIASIYPLKLGKTLVSFTQSLILILMRATRKFKVNTKVIRTIQSFLQTIQSHQHEDEGLVGCIKKIQEHKYFHME